jgi:RNA polymerase sigma-70 factor (ECF subfamily)
MMSTMTFAECDVGRAASDAELIATSLDDPQAFSAVFERHVDAIHRWLIRRVGPDLAEDLTAETFTRAFDRRDRFDGSYEDARPWLFGIASNLIHDHRRAELRRLRALARVRNQNAGDEDFATAAVARLDASVSGPAVAAALAALRPQEREVLLLLAWADLSYEEIAQATSLPLGTVRSRLSRARRKLRTELDNFGGNHV